MEATAHAESQKLTIPRYAFGLVALVLLGLLLRVGLAGSDALASLLPWLNPVPVNLYYVSAEGGYLVPVAHELRRDESPEALVTRLLLPENNPRLISPLSGDVRLVASSFEDGLLELSFSAPFSFDSSIPREFLALEASLYSHPQVEQLILRWNGQVTEAPALQLVHLSRDGQIVALPVQGQELADLLEAYMQLSRDPAYLALPEDVVLLDYSLNPANGLLRLNFNYTDSLRQLATTDADGMRQILLGLIATVTAHPSVEAVLLDFDGHAQLGLGQCANLLRAPQTGAGILNAAS